MFRCTCRTAAIAKRIRRNDLVLVQRRSSSLRAAVGEKLSFRELAINAAFLCTAAGLLSGGAWWAVGRDMARRGSPDPGQVLHKAKSFNEGKAGHEALLEV
jgi:hypothetical protein